MSDIVRVRRTRSRVIPVDTQHFEPQIDAAMNAFRSDVSYAVHMARAAVAIARKREVWQARREARNAMAL